MIQDKNSFNYPCSSPPRGHAYGPVGWWYFQEGHPYVKIVN